MAQHNLRQNHPTAYDHEEKCIRTMQQLIIVCSECARYISNVPFIFCGYPICIGCFCKAVPRNTVSSLIDCSQSIEGDRRYTMQDYLRVVCSAEKFGIDGTEMIEQHLKHAYSRYDIEQMIGNLVDWSNNVSQHTQSLKNELNQQAIQQQNNQVQQNIADNNILKMVDYQLSDYMLSSLHPNSPKNTQQLFLSHKLYQDQLTHQIATIIDHISSTNHTRKTNNAIPSIIAKLRYAKSKQQKRKMRDRDEQMLVRGRQEIDIMHSYQSLLAQNQMITNRRQEKKQKVQNKEVKKKIRKPAQHKKNSHRYADTALY